MKLAIFDLDGTLIDSMKVWRTVGYDFVVENCGVIPDQKLNSVLRTMSFPESAKFLTEKFNVDLSADEILHHWFSKIEYAYKNTIGLIDGVHDYLNKLKQENIKMCIATACTKDLAEGICKRLKIYDFMEFLITVEEIGVNKDKPDIFLYCSEKYNLKPNECTVFEDSLHSIITAKKAGFNIVAVKDDDGDEDLNEIIRNSQKQIYTYTELLKD
ncbi:MAG: HAD family hydrolase [Oscillospiraceae bacterium]